MSSARSIALAVLVSQLACVHSRLQPAAGEQGLPLKVSSREASVRFPVENRSYWEWNRPQASGWSLEYEWAIELGEEPIVAFGFHLFNIRPQPAGGTLAELLKAGQVSVWRSEGSRRLILEGAKLSVAAEDSAIVFNITDAPTLDLLFGSHPLSAVLIAHTPYQAQTVTPVRVVYSKH